MRSRLLAGWRALRGFALGFVGLSAPAPREPRELHRQLRERARGRTPCC
jgi:hypothetical protein